MRIGDYCVVKSESGIIFGKLVEHDIKNNMVKLKGCKKVNTKYDANAFDLACYGPIYTSYDKENVLSDTINSIYVMSVFGIYECTEEAIKKWLD